MILFNNKIKAQLHEMWFYEKEDQVQSERNNVLDTLFWRGLFHLEVEIVVESLFDELG